MQDTTSDGRIDIIIFPSGGREVIGRVAAYPPVPETAYMPLVAAFVAEHQGLEKPEKHTGYYSVKNGVCAMQWAGYAGELPQEEPEEVDFDALRAQAEAVMADTGQPVAGEVLDI